MPPALATFLFELINFLLLAALIGWFLFKPVREMLDARRTAAAAQAEEARSRSAEADRLKAEWEARTTAFDQEIADARARRLEAAHREADAIVARARDAADREQDRAARLQADVDQRQVEALAAAVAAASRDAVARLLTSIGAPALDGSLVRAACGELAALAAPSLGAVTIESASALAENDRAALVAAINGRAKSVAYDVVPALGAGVAVTTARGRVDASAAGLAAVAERQLRVQLTRDEKVLTP